MYQESKQKIWEDRHFETVLGHIKRKDTKSLSDCLKHSHDANLCNAYGESLLHFAAMHYHFDGVEALLAHGADIHSKTKAGFTPFHWACQCENNDAIIIQLILAGADVNAQTNSGATPAMLCVTNMGYLSILFKEKINLTLKERGGLTLLGVVNKLPELPQFDSVKEFVGKFYAEHENNALNQLIEGNHAKQEGIVF